MNKKIKKAAALKYDPNQNNAPIISAVGLGIVAEKIVETAQKNEVPVVEDSSVAEVLSSFSVGDTIPEQLYEIVAQVLVFIAEADANYKSKFIK